MIGVIFSVLRAGLSKGGMARLGWGWTRATSPKGALLAVELLFRLLLMLRSRHVQPVFFTC